jgi:hypothetical protein
VGIPVLINEAYRANGSIKTVWGGADVLVYYSSIISLIGTAFLGSITIYLTKKANIDAKRASEEANKLNAKANDINDRLIKIEENRDIKENSPFVMISNWKVWQSSFHPKKNKTNQVYINMKSDNNGELLLVLFEFINTSKSFCQIRLDKLYKGEQDFFDGTTDTNNSNLMLSPSERGEIILCFRINQVESLRCSKMIMKLNIHNFIDELYVEEFEFRMSPLNKIQNSSNETGEWDVTVYSQNFHLTHCKINPLYNPDTDPQDIKYIKTSIK